MEQKHCFPAPVFSEYIFWQFPVGVIKLILHLVSLVMAFDTMLLPQSVLNHEKFIYHDKSVYFSAFSFFPQLQNSDNASAMHNNTLIICLCFITYHLLFPLMAFLFFGGKFPSSLNVSFPIYYI